jgi:predicted nucleic acid-binding protein
MDDPLVLDTSVIVKWFRQGEILAGQALALRSSYLDGLAPVTVPTLLAYELANVLHYKSDLTTAQVEDATQSLFDMGLEWVAPSARMMRRAVVIAREFETTVYDAVFASLAEAQRATFVTADRRLADRLKTLGCVRFLGQDGD